MWLLPVMILGSAFAIILQPYVTNYTAVTIPADADLMLLETSNTGAKAKITAENLRSYMTANSWDYLLVANSWDYYTTNPLAYITGGQVLADNGLTKTVNTVEMWGTLTKSTNIYNDWNNFYVRGDWLNAISNAWIDNYLATHPTSIELYSNNWDMTVTDWVAEINDAFWSKGINYASDYSGNYDARTLIDKWYVDAEILSATPDTIYTADGTLLGSRTIDASWNILNFTNLGFLWFNWANNFEIEFDWAEFKFQSDRMQLNSPLAWNFDFNDLWAVWHDWQATPLWLQYYADYSWTMVDRSIVDKWYVDWEIETASWFYVHLEWDEEINWIKTFSDNTVFNWNTFFNGTATYINSTNLDVEDKNIFLWVITGATDITANWGGTLLSWDNQHWRTFDNANDSFDIETDNLNVTNWAEYRINDVNILASTVANSTTLGATQNAISGFVYWLWYLTTETDPVWSAVSADYLLVADSWTYYNNTIASSLLPYLTIANSGNYYDTNFAIDSWTYYDANIASSLSPYLLLANSWDYYTTNPLNYITLAEVPADENIYNIDWTLTSDRTISAGGNSLTITWWLNTLIDSTYTRIKSSTDANTFVTVTTDDVSINSSDNITVWDTANEIIIWDIYDAWFDESYMEMDVLNKDRKVSLNWASDLLSMSNWAFSYAGWAGEMFFNSNWFAMYTPWLPATRNEIGYDTTTKIATVRGQSWVTLTTQWAEILMSPTLIQSSINDSYIAIADSPWAEWVYISSKEWPVFIGYYDSQTVPDTDEVNIWANTEINLKVASVGFWERLLVTSWVVAIWSDQVSVQARNNVWLLLDWGNLPIYMWYSMWWVPTPDTDEIYMSANTDITIETPIMELTGWVMRMTDNGSSRQFAINISWELDVQFLSWSTRETASTFTK